MKFYFWYFFQIWSYYSSYFLYIHTALVQEQIRHKEKLDKEIASSMEEKGKLTKDLSKLEQELILKEQQRRTTANSNAQVIILM